MIKVMIVEDEPEIRRILGKMIEKQDGQKKVTASINGRFHEAQYGFIGTTANDGNTPVIKQVAAEVRILNEEAKL